MIRIITTADDYGMSQAINEAIIDCINNGTLTSVNVMVNMPFLNSDIKDKKRISIGIHWNLTIGKCVADKNDVSSLVDENGSFFPYETFKKRIKKGLVKKSHILVELEAQFQRFCSIFGYAPKYWNTHQNIVLLPKISSCFFKTGKRLEIEYTRTFCRKYIDYESLSFKRRIREFFVRIFVNYMFNVKFSFCSKTPNYREIVFNRKNKNDLNLMDAMLSKCKKNKSVEIVYHPSKRIDCDSFGTIGKERIDEYIFLTTNKNNLFEILNKHDAKLVSFDEIKN